MTFKQTQVLSLRCELILKSQSQMRVRIKISNSLFDVWKSENSLMSKAEQSQVTGQILMILQTYSMIQDQISF